MLILHSLLYNKISIFICKNIYLHIKNCLKSLLPFNNTLNFVNFSLYKIYFVQVLVILKQIVNVAILFQITKEESVQMTVHLIRSFVTL